jgi:hypothetical protein
MDNRLSMPLDVAGPRSELPDGEVVEIPLLLPGWQATALETVAHENGLTTAAMVRHLLRDFILAPGPAQTGPLP